MDIKQLEEQLKSYRSTQSPSELLNTVFDLLSKDPSWEERELLELWLMTYSFEDTDRVVQYWKSQLDGGSKIRQKKATTFLMVLAKTNTSAKNVLREFLNTVNLEEDPTWENVKVRFDDLDNQ
jgi:Zn-dependent M16 (insulinase) family peptidase